MVQTACFSRDQLRDFSLGCVSAEAEERIAEHLDQCESCQEAAAECDRSADSLVAALRVPDDVPSEEDMHCDAALALARQLAVGSAGARHERTEPIRLREYELLRKLGEGGMGTVYLARHTRLDRIVALKVLPPDRMRDSSAVARFEREMRAVGGLDHPSIVRATDAGDVDGTHFLVMEYVEGLDLSSLVERLGPIGIADACELVREAALGLQHVHERGMVHRDIKPSNLMLTPRGEVKILDLGLALLQRGDGELQGITTVGRFMGTLDYMAPEQADDSHEVDIRADVYGLGATLYRLICGVPPFAGKDYRSPLKKLKALAIEPVPPVRERRPDVPAGLAQVIERMLAKEPADRFAAPAEVAKALVPFTAGSDLAKLQRSAESSQFAPQVETVGQVSNRPDRAGGTPRRSRRRLLVVLLAFFALIAGAAIYIETDKGTLVIRSPDPGIEVLIRRNERPVDDWELQRGENRTTVRSGSYEIVLIGASDGLRVKDGTFTLTRGDEHVATIERLAQRGKSTTDSAQKTSAIRSPAQRREPATPAAASDRQALQGTWEVVSGEQSGENDTQANVAQWLKVRFGPNEFVIWKGQSVEAKGPWMLHPAEQPQTIILSSIHSHGRADRKIYWARYELNGDELRLAISDQKSPADFRPHKDTSALWLRRTKGPDESHPETPQSAVEVKIFSFVNADAAEAAKVARQLMPEDRVLIAPDARTNSLVIQGSAKDLETLTAIFLRLDEKPRSPAENGTRAEGQNAADMLLEKIAGASDRLWNVLGLRVARAAPHELGSQSRYAAGAAVTEVRASSPAASAGIRVGDVLVELGSSMVAAPDELDSAIKRTVLQGHYALRYKLLRAGDPRQGVMEFPDNPLQGVWEFEGLQDGGRSAPAEVLKSLKLILTEERFQFWEKGRIDKQGTYELDPSAEPKTITFNESGANKPTRGIYRREDGRLWITLNETPGGERPNAFVSERGSPNDTLMELRQTKQAVPPIEAGEESERAKKDTAQPAGGAQPITSEVPSSLAKTSERISFNFKNAPWPDVLKLLADKAGLTLDLRDVPPGEFTYTDPKEYTPAEALDVLNGYLISRGYVLVRRDNFLVSLQIGNVPENLIPTVTIDELPQRGRNELLNVVFPLEGVKAEDWVDEIRNALDVVGSKGQVAVLERSNAIAVTDFGGNLRRVHRLLSDVLAKSGPDAGPAESLQGVWEVKGAQDSGRQTPGEEIKALKLVFAGERFEFRGLQQRGTYTIDPTAEPKSITFFEDGKEKPLMGIYRLENDKLWIVFNEGRDGERPDAFVSEPDSPNDVLLELRRTEEPVPEPLHARQAASAAAEHDHSEPDANQVAGLLDTWNLLGLELEPTESAEGPLLKVTRVRHDSPAAKANLRPGDVLLQAGERNLTNLASFGAAVLRAARVGSDDLRFSGVRGDEPLHGWLPIPKEDVVASWLWHEYGVTPRPVAPLTAKLLEWIGLHLSPIGRDRFRGKDIFSEYTGGLNVTSSRTNGPAWNAGIQSGIVVGLQGRPLTTLKELDSAMQYAVEQISRGEAESLQFQVLRSGKPFQVDVPVPDQLDAPGSNTESRHGLQQVAVLGLTLRPATARELGSPTKYRGGLAVVHVRPSSPASAAGIRAGDVLVGLGQWETTTIDNVDFAVQRSAAANLGSLKFYILRDGGTVYGTLAIPDAPVDGAPAVESAAAEPAPEATYDGRTFDEWLRVMGTERKVESVTEAMAAVSTLANGDRGGKAARAILNEAKEFQTDVRVRSEAAKALQRLDSPEAIAALSEELKSGTTQMRKLVLDALRLRKSQTGGIRDEHARAAVPEIIEASRDPEMSIRFTALRLATELDPDRPEVRQRLREAASDADEDAVFRAFAAERLARIAPQSDGLLEVLMELARASHDEPEASSGAGEWAIIGLRHLGPQGAPAVSVLLPFLSEERRPRFGRLAVEALGAMGPAAATSEVIEALERLTKSSDEQTPPDLAAAAAEALRSIREQESDPAR